MKLLRTILGNRRQYDPGNRSHLASFIEDYGDDKENLKRLEAAGAIQLTKPKKVRAAQKKKSVVKTAPRRTRSQMKTAKE